MQRPWIIYLILIAADVLVGWMISESPMPLLLVMVGVGVFGFLSLIDRFSSFHLAKRTAPVLAIAYFFVEWWLFRQGLARVMLSDLPVLYHLGLAVHFWLWMRYASDSSGDKNFTIWIALVAGGLIFWTAGTTEIYGNSKLLVRSLAALGIALPVWQFFQNTRYKIQPATLLATVGAAILLASFVGPMDRVSGRIFEWVNRDVDDSFLNGTGVNPDLTTVGDGAIDGSSRQLPDRADLQLNDEIQAHLLIENRTDFGRLMQRPVYLKTSSLAVFETPSRLAPARRATWFLDSEDGDVDGQTFVKPPGNPVLEYSVLIERDLVSTLPLISGTDRVHLDSIYEFADGWWQIEPREQQQLIRFKAATPLTSLEPLPLSNKSLQSAKTDKFPFRTVPFSGLSLNIRDLARSITKREPTLTGKLNAVKQFFAEETRYSLAYRNPKNLDPLENFLFHEKRGHCELYASATVLMLRHLDIPSRVSYGYLGGEYDLENRLITFRDRDYHAWPEVLVEGKGWQVFDTTPAAAGRVAPPQPADNRTASEVNLASYEDIGSVEQVFDTQRSSFERILDAILLFLSRHFMTLLGFIAVAGAVWSIFARKQRTQINSPSMRDGKLRDPDDISHLPAFVPELLTFAREKGIPKQSSQTWREFLDQLKLAELCQNEFDEMIHYLYSILYCNGTRDRSQEREFTKITQALNNQ